MAFLSRLRTLIKITIYTKTLKTICKALQPPYSMIIGGKATETRGWEWAELYLHSPYMPSWLVQKQLPLYWSYSEETQVYRNKKRETAKRAALLSKRLAIKGMYAKILLETRKDTATDAEVGRAHKERTWGCVCHHWLCNSFIAELAYFTPS